MDWQRYKTLCERPDVMSRWMLNETAALVPKRLRTALRATLTTVPLAKPSDHKGGADTDMFVLDAEAPVAAIAAAVAQAAACGARTRQGRGLGGIVAAWREVDQWCAAR